MELLEGLVLGAKIHVDTAFIWNFWHLEPEMKNLRNTPGIITESFLVTSKLKNKIKNQIIA